MPTEKEKMLSGQLHNVADPQLLAERRRARSLVYQLNKTDYGDTTRYQEIISQLLPNCASDISVRAPFYCDYGYNIYTGLNVFLNYDCVILDTCPVRIGANTMFGPGVHIYAATHPNDFLKRRGVLEFGKLVSIGEDCWIGGHVTILPGVNIGHRCIIGAGSVVTKDVPDDTSVVGNPAKALISPYEKRQI